MMSKVLINWGGTHKEMFLIYCFTSNTLFFSQQAMQIDFIFIFFSGEGLLQKMDNGNTKESN